MQWREIFTIIGAFAAVIGVAGKVFLAQFNATMNERFRSMEQARTQASEMWGQRFDKLEQASNDEREQMRKVEKDLLQLRAELPERYVRREDWVRSQSIVEGKIDGLALRIENILLKRGD